MFGKESLEQEHEDIRTVIKALKYARDSGYFDKVLLNEVIDQGYVELKDIENEISAQETRNTI